ncbi:GPI inositol-deacylase [Myxococcus sp. XM-1-1-1]|uniref:esterase/lipase family protein n=1 Tax=Myxococcus sp. XM-1-1-1 TaxID=2874602 RepID=UPI001CBFE490|nr:GPI inositol-deacylase [Myxococcus sp. XM-1-1-1]MBZ4410909.1 GPI inositol-deacylase [Myxococcus sp. XM-1-1-1]
MASVGKVDVALGVLNGVLGDYLHRQNNALATPMGLYHQGLPLPVEREALRAAHPTSTGRVALWVHGLAVTEAVWAFPSEPTTDYGTLLERDAGFTPLYLRYNTGLHISDNGETLAHLLQRLVAEFPVPIAELVLVGYSMGGLVLRSACHLADEAGLPWLCLVRRSCSIGVPHFGSPLERMGTVVAQVLRAVPNPYTRLVADVVDLRSSGVKDLGVARLRRQDWEDTSTPCTPLRPPQGIAHHLIVGALGQEGRWVSALFGDGVISLASASGRTGPRDSSPLFPAQNVQVVAGIDHVTLAHHASVYERLRASLTMEAS